MREREGESRPKTLLVMMKKKSSAFFCVIHTTLVAAAIVQILELRKRISLVASICGLLLPKKFANISPCL
jgi:hypothetical protein